MKKIKASGTVIFVYDGSKSVSVEWDVNKTKNGVTTEDWEIDPENKLLQIVYLSGTAVDFPSCFTSVGNYDGHIVRAAILKQIYLIFPI